MTLKEGIYLLSQIPGISIADRKIVVIESDDWGSIRMPSQEVRDALRKEGIQIDSNPYSKLDSLESDMDYNELMYSIDNIRNTYGKSPVITANYIMANPQFDLIAESNFESFVYELFSDTYRQRDDDDRTILAMNNAINGKYLVPQYHGREHLNVMKWLSLLKNKHPELSVAFKNKTFGIDCKIPSGRSSNLMAAFDYEDEAEFQFVSESIKEGYSLFEEVFGFRPKSIVAPCHVWDERHEQVFNELGIQFIQTSLVQLKPRKNGYKKQYRFLGKKNKFGQRYLVRNISFEPSTMPNYPWIEKILRKAELIFAAQKPIMISMHRINFSGGIESSNREKNLELFTKLIGVLLERFPEIEFMSSDQLGSLIVEGN